MLQDLYEIWKDMVGHPQLGAGSSFEETEPFTSGGAASSKHVILYLPFTTITSRSRTTKGRTSKFREMPTPMGLRSVVEVSVNRMPGRLTTSTFCTYSQSSRHWMRMRQAMSPYRRSISSQCLVQTGGGMSRLSRLKRLLKWWQPLALACILGYRYASGSASSRLEVLTAFSGRLASLHVRLPT